MENPGHIQFWNTHKGTLCVKVSSSITPYLENQFCSCSQNVAAQSERVGRGVKRGLWWLRNESY